MALRDSLPSTWLVAVAALAGVVAGVLWGRVSPPAPPGEPPPRPPAAAPGPSAGGAAPPAFVIPGAPPADVAREMEEALRGAFSGEADDPASRRSRDEAFARVKGLTARWHAATGRDPLASAAWWRAALRRTMAPEERAAPGWAEEEVDFLGAGIRSLVSTPPGADVYHPVILCIVEGGEGARPFLEQEYDSLLGTHVVVAVTLRPPGEAASDPVLLDPRTAMLAVGRAARTRALDRDRVVLDGFGRGVAAAATLAADSARAFCGAVLRAPEEVGRPAANLAANPLLVIEPPAEEGPVAAAAAGIREAAPGARFLPPGDPAAVASWIAALPPRAAADPRNPRSWCAVTGDRWLSFGHSFVVKRTTGFGPGRLVSVRIARDPARNAVVLETSGVGEILLLLSDEGLDLDRPVKVFHDGALVGERKVERSLDTLRTWLGVAEHTVFAPAEWTLRLE